MTISFHCKYCSKKIEASEKSAGKWGRCPSCHNKIYVPDLNAEIDDLKLAPGDKTEEAKKQQLMQGTYELEQNILQERESPNNKKSTVSKPPEISNQQLEQNIISYLRQVANGDLGKAEQILSSITPYSFQSRKILDRMAVSDMPEPELEDVPPQVLAGLIRQLHSTIS